MKRIFLYGLLLFMFRDCEAQKLEIKYCPWFNNFTGTCVITCNDSTCMLQFNIVEKYVPGFLLWIDRSKESNKILCYDNELISIEQMNKVKDLYQKASCLASNSGYAMIDGNYLHITGTFYSDTLYNKFELYYPTKTKDILEYDFYKLSIEIMLETLKNKRSKGYAKYIGKYL